jgi:DNA processing protein
VSNFGDQLDWLRLLRSRRVGISTFWRLMADHGSAKAALAALPGIARDAGVPDYQICPEGVVLAELKAGRAAGAELVRKGDGAYPAGLGDIADAPPLLWIKGDAALLARPMLALVGARNASSLGTRMTRALAGDLSAAGFVVVSGLARGVDSAAHEAALHGGTIAVMAGGVDVIYPPENAGIADRIAAEGLLISEQPMGLQPQARHFPARNRIISGLAQAVVVVEAAARSGSLITARNALDQGREVLAVPGHPFDARASGCNMLIRDGAILVRSAADVIEALSQPAAVTTPHQPLAPPIHVARASAHRADLRQTAALHRQILDRLGPSPMAEDQLIRDLAHPASAVTPVIVELELDGRIARAAGGMLALVN